MQNDFAIKILSQLSAFLKPSESWRNNIGSYIYIANIDLGEFLIGFKDNLENEILKFYLSLVPITSFYNIL